MAICGLMISSSAIAQEFGFIGGFHQTSADSSTDGANVTTEAEGKLGFKLGLAVNFELVEGSAFRTGFLWNNRKFAVTGKNTLINTEATTDFNFNYFDIPALYQLNVNEMVGFFGGLVVAINIGDDTSPSSDFKAETMIPLLTAGLNLMFDDQIGFDFYYERGMGKFAKMDGASVADFSTFGANFLYWF